MCNTTSHGTLINVHVARHPGQRLGHLLSQPGEKENDLPKQENTIQEKLTELAKREAEVGKPKSNWELQGVIGLAVFVLGFLAGR
jgi:hypothetical protein